tara:strand:+ start:20252 stop:21643 length:1392 start_codon:yes stop_codon:yes gene_type:complete
MWPHKKLSSVSKINMGQSPPSSTYNYEEKGLPFFQGKKEFGEIYPVPEKWCSQPKKIALKGDILISVRAPVGDVNIANQECCIGRGLAAIQFEGDLKYLFYLIQSNKHELEKQGTGSTFKAISGNILKNFSIPYPPLPTQHRIVVKIEELFSELDNGVDSLKKAQKQLIVYRQAVLKDAFEGKLTKDWREQQSNLPTPEDILEQIKTERETYYEQKIVEWKQELKKWDNGGRTGRKPKKPKKQSDISKYSDVEEKEFLIIPNNWSWIKSGQIFNNVTSGSRGWAKYYSEHGALFVRITNLDFDSLELNLIEEKCQYVDLPGKLEGHRTRIKEGDFLFSITGYLGMFAIAPNLKEAYVNQHIAIARPINKINNKFFGYWIISKIGGRFYLNKNDRGVTKSGLRLEDIETFPVPICSNKEQNQIVQEIESRLSVVDQLEKTIEENLLKAEALRQSILKKAFGGSW